MVIRMRPNFYQAGILISRVTRVPLHSLSLQKHTEERHMKMQREGDCPQTRKWGFTRNWISCHFNMRLLASRTVKRKNVSCLSTTWYFIMAPSWLIQIGRITWNLDHTPHSWSHHFFFLNVLYPILHLSFWRLGFLHVSIWMA